MADSYEDLPAHRAEITNLFLSWRRGDAGAFNVLFEQLYDELRALARRQVARARPGDTLCTTALLHEAYLRLVDSARVNVSEREHFLALAARAMRYVLVDYVREHAALKRGGGLEIVELQETISASGPTADQLLTVHRALECLETLDARQAQVFDLRAFGGLSVVETASVLSVSTKTVKRDWRKARLFLMHELSAAMDTR